MRAVNDLVALGEIGIRFIVAAVSGVPRSEQGAVDAIGVAEDGAGVDRRVLEECVIAIGDLHAQTPARARTALLASGRDPLESAPVAGGRDTERFASTSPRIATTTADRTTEVLEQRLHRVALEAKLVEKHRRS